ncbi:MAG TPA: alpha/beta hydrolase [Dehalococcoidia bacterium]|nr:alpha/beta hydrolase [Dehalococcoidia bacterium]
MPYTKNGTINIYYEVEGKGPPLLMLHGLTRSLKDYRETGFVKSLNDEYQVILMDARGHGKSDKPHNPAMYDTNILAGDVITVLDSLGIETINLFGYSFGGGIAFECAKHAPERMKSLIVGGAGARQPTSEMYDELINSLKIGKEAVTSKYEGGGELSPQETHLLKIDLDAIDALCKAIVSSPKVIDDVSNMNIPFLLFVGEFDNPSIVKETSDLLPDATFILLPGLDHIQAGSRPDLIVPHIKEFLSRIN